MTQFSSRRALCAALVSAFPVGVFCSTAANAQAPASKPSAPDAGVRFQKYLTTYAAQNRWAIVAEGAPLSLDESFVDSAKFSRAAPDTQFKIIADAADYDAKHEANSPVWVLTKRYSSPRDMPCVTFAECEAALKKIATYISPLVINTTGKGDTAYNLVQGLYRTFTPEQKKQMQMQASGDRQPMPDKPISVAALKPEQQRAAQLMAVRLYLRDFPERCKSQSDFLKRVEAAKISRAAKTKNAADPKVFVLLDAKTPPDGAPLGGIGWLAAPDTAVVLPPAAPTTLAKEVARIDAAQQTAKQLPCEVDAALADKLLTVAGMENVDALSQLKALSEIYGLRLRTTNTARIVGFRSDWKDSVTLSNFRDMIAYTLPPAYMRVITGDVSESEIPKTSVLRDLGSSTMRSDFAATADREATKQLHLAHDAETDAAKEKTITVAELTPSQQPAFAFIVMYSFLSDTVRVLNQSVPGIVAHQSDLAVAVQQIKDTKNVPNLQMTLYYKNPDGSFNPGGGIEGIPVPDGL